eukprot:15478232-Alexandrium_andersonii.AAC.1
MQSHPVACVVRDPIFATATTAQVASAMLLMATSRVKAVSIVDHGIMCLQCLGGCVVLWLVALWAGGSGPLLDRCHR